MFTITVLLLKGGVGKSTIAIALAEAAALSVPTVLIDADPMGSGVRWAEQAAKHDHPLRCAVRVVPAADLASRVHSLGREAGIVVIDAPPPGPGAERIADSAVMAADYVVMPVTPQPADLDRVNPTYAIVRKHGKPARAVLNQVRAGLIDRDIALEALRAWHVPVFDTQLPLTALVQRAYGQPVNSGPLQQFGVRLLTEILTEVHRNDQAS
jgi:chromosome partitioning protein